MPRNKILIIGLLLLASLSPVSTAAAQTPASQIIIEVNAFRATLGLPPFRVNAALSAAAQQQANFMAANNIYSHTGAGGSTPLSRAQAAGYFGRVSENIVGGSNMTPRQGLIWWQNSAVHYATITSNRYTEIGAGFAQGFDQNFYAIVVGQPSNAPVNNTADAGDQNAPIQVIPITLAQPREDGSLVHRIEEGQSLWQLAAHYDVALSWLYQINGLSEGDFVSPGDEIYIRLAEGQVPPPTATPPSTYIVQKGDTAWKIAALNGITLEELLWYNGLSEDSFIQPGQELKVRLEPGEAPPPTPTPQQSYIVKAGDTPLGIAGRFGLTLDELLAFNGLAPNPLLQVGQELRIRPPEPTPTAVPTEPSPTAAPPTATPTAAIVTPLAAPTATPLPVPTPTASPEGTLGAAKSGANALMVFGAMILAAVAVSILAIKQRH